VVIFFEWDTTQKLEEQLKDTIDARRTMRNYIYDYQADQADPMQEKVLARYTQDIMDLNRELIKRGK
jgi:hypothetical protein